MYSLFVHPFDIDGLENPFRLFDDSVPAQLHIDKMKYDIYLKYRGHHTRNLPKKSYFIKLKTPRRLLGSCEFHLNAEYDLIFYS